MHSRSLFSGADVNEDDTTRQAGDGGLDDEKTYMETDFERVAGCSGGL